MVREEMERGVFDIEAVKHANATLIATIDESLRDRRRRQGPPRRGRGRTGEDGGRAARHAGLGPRPQPAPAPPRRPEAGAPAAMRPAARACPGAAVLCWRWRLRPVPPPCRRRPPPPARGPGAAAAPPPASAASEALRASITPRCRPTCWRRACCAPTAAGRYALHRPDAGRQLHPHRALRRIRPRRRRPRASADRKAACAAGKQPVRVGLRFGASVPAGPAGDGPRPHRLLPCAAVADHRPSDPAVRRPHPNFFIYIVNEDERAPLARRSAPPCRACRAGRCRGHHRHAALHLLPGLCAVRRQRAAPTPAPLP